METGSNQKKRKRDDEDAGTGPVGGASAQDGKEPAGVVPAAKKVVDLAALKAKMAETKRKMAEVKAATAAGGQDMGNNVTGTESTSKSTLSSSIAPLAPISTATSSAHARYLQEQQEKRLRDQKKAEKAFTKKETKSIDPSFDPRLRSAPTERKARPLVFLEAGELTKRAEIEQHKLEATIETKKPIRDSSVDSTPSAPTRPAVSTSIEFDWWDAPYIKAKETSNSSMEVDTSPNTFDSSLLREDLVTLMIHHPVLTLPVAEAPEPEPRAAMLTPEQQKKISRQRRFIERQTRREEQLLGIRAPEKSRMRISNMMKMNSDAITDPTLVEKRAQDELAEREARHFARNAERQLTPEQRKAKKWEKLKEDTSLSSSVSVFRVLSLANGKNRSKVDNEVRFNSLSGVVVYSEDFALVVVEGGPKSVQRFTKKMLKKIPWTQPLPPVIVKETTEAGKTEPEKPKIYGKNIDPDDNQCHLVWKGEVLRRSFEGFRFTHPGRGARAYLESLGVAHYYDAAKSFQPSEVIL